MIQPPENREERAALAIQWIREQKRFDMSSWISHIDPNDPNVNMQEAVSCESSACIAGTIVLRAYAETPIKDVVFDDAYAVWGDDPEFQYCSFMFSEVAGNWLKLDPEDRNAMFSPDFKHGLEIDDPLDHITADHAIKMLERWGKTGEIDWTHANLRSDEDPNLWMKWDP